MKPAARWVIYVLAALLVLLAVDCWLIHPAGRWQLVVSHGYGVMKMDTTTGDVWMRIEGEWVPMKDEPKKK